MKSLTIPETSKLTGEPIATLYKRLDRSGVILPRNEHGNILVPIGLAIPPKLAEQYFRSLYMSNKA